MVHARAGRTEEALEVLEAAHYLQPHRADILFQYGRVLQAAGRAREARLRFEAVLRLEPEFPGARAQLAALSASAPSSTSFQGETRAPGTFAVGTSPRDREQASNTDVRPPLSEDETVPASPEARTEPGTALAGRSASLPEGMPAETDTRPAFRRRPATRFDPFNVPGEADEFLPAPPPLPGWEPEQLPGFLGLFRATLYLWGQQPLVWIALLALPNIGALLLAQALRGLEGDHQWLGLLVWTVALGVGATPAMIAMADQWFHGRVFAVDRELIPARLLRGLPVTLGYSLVTLGVFGILLALRSRFSADVLLLMGLVLAAPFHALLAPALVMAINEGPGGWQAFRTAVTMAGKRTWMHLALIFAVGVVVGGALGVLAWAFAVTLKLRGEGVFGVMRVAGVSLAESLWVALVTICGTDTLAARTTDEGEGGEGEPSEAPVDTRAMARPDGPGSPI